MEGRRKVSRLQVRRFGSIISSGLVYEGFGIAPSEAGHQLVEDEAAGSAWQCLKLFYDHHSKVLKTLSSN